MFEGLRQRKMADPRTVGRPASTTAVLEPLEPRQFFSASPAVVDTHIYAPHATVRGETLPQWTADWWKWAFSIPASTNPLLDTTGAQSSKGDVGKVFFLAGVGFGAPNTVTRQATLPSGTPVLFPIINSIADETEPDSVGPDHFTEAQLRLLAAEFIGAAGDGASNTLSATVDGQPITGLSDHRELSPVFSYTMPSTDNLWQAIGFDATTATPPAVSDGYWVMLKPLEPGHHTLHINASAVTVFGDYTQDVTYDITVLPQGQYDHQQATTVPPATAGQAVATSSDVHKKLLEDVLGG